MHILERESYETIILKKKAKEKVVMRVTKGRHRSLRKASTDIHISRPWPAEFQLLRVS